MLLTTVSTCFSSAATTYAPALSPELLFYGLYYSLP